MKPRVRSLSDGFCQDFFCDFFGKIEYFVCAVFAVLHKAEEHIVPHHGLIAVFASNFADAVQMLQQNIMAVAIAVFIKISAQTHHVRFVHTDMDLTRTERF